jgi:hypothetical protein
MDPVGGNPEHAMRMAHLKRVELAYVAAGGKLPGHADGKWDPTVKATEHNRETVSGRKMVSTTITEYLADCRVRQGKSGYGLAARTPGDYEDPYVSFYSALGVARNSEIGMLPCSSATLKVDVGGGAGYAIPRSITQAINYILKLFGSKKQIAGYGGVAIAKPTTLINTTGNRGGCRPIS